MASEEILAYYARRAHEYEQIYAKPERQGGLDLVHTWLRDALVGHRVLEIACGAGDWTAELGGGGSRSHRCQP